MTEPLLSLKDLTVCVADSSVDKKIVKDVSLDIPVGKIVALVGGSGSGKTTIGLSILRLLPSALYLNNGKIIFNGENILEHDSLKMQTLRGKQISMVFQEPLNAFNPVFTIGYQIAEVLKVHTHLSLQQIRDKIPYLLQMVGINDANRIAQSYPHQLSGGLRQRAMIAIAIAADPQILIADEPTSNLDVTWQAHIIELFRKLNQELKISILLITHDLGMVSHLADSVIVLFQGGIVEFGPTQEVLKQPRHPYTVELMNAMVV